jgi:nitroreductase
MELLDAIATTRTIRRYRAEPVDEQDLASIVWSASRAPSGSNRQPFRLLVLRDSALAVEAKRLLAAAAQSAWRAKRRRDGYAEGTGAVAGSPKARMAATMDQFVEHFAETPVVILACLQRYREPSPTEGASVYPAVQNLLLAARDLGYGGAISMWHTLCEPALRELLQVPEQAFIAATISLGRPAGSHGPVRRRPVRELVFEDQWGVAAPWAVDPPGTCFTQAGPPAGR